MTDLSDAYTRLVEAQGATTTVELGEVRAADFRRFAYAIGDINPRYFEGDPVSEAPPVFLSAVMGWDAGPLESELRAAEKSGRMNEDMLGMLANIQLKKNDKVGYVNTIEKLAASYPKAQYWNDLLNRVHGQDPRRVDRPAVQVAPVQGGAHMVPLGRGPGSVGGERPIRGPASVPEPTQRR